MMEIPTTSQTRLPKVTEVVEEDQTFEGIANYPPPPCFEVIRNGADSPEVENETLDETASDMDNNEPKPEVVDDDEDIAFYESYWAQNTSAHGISRVANTHKFQKFVWIAALLGCFSYVTFEVYRAVATYNLHLTTTEINRINSKEIEFPSVTICNFNRWRRSRLTPEVLAQLEKIISVYSYDYVIPDIAEISNPEEVKLDEVLNPTTTPPPTKPPVSTTEPPPVECTLPMALAGLAYDTSAPISSENKVLEGTTLTYRCTSEDRVLIDGDEVHRCSENGDFEERVPMCISSSPTGDRYVLVNNASNREAIAVSVPLDTQRAEESLPGVTMCFWIKIEKGDNLGTILSYGTEDRPILAVSQVPQSTSDDIYGVKYSLFGAEGKTITLAGFDQWNPFCLQYSAADSTIQLYKFLMFGSTFKLYEEDGLLDTPEFPLNGRMVMFNTYQSYLNVLENRPVEEPSSGGGIANVNVWDRLISIEIMNTLLWEGNVYSMTQDTVSAASGTIMTTTLSFNVSAGQGMPVNVYGEDVHGSLSRVKRQAAEEFTTPIIPTTTGELTTLSPPTEPLNESNQSNSTTGSIDDALKDVFNYADFTKKAGWQLVDSKSNHSENETNTLLKCTYRGKTCDSRWFIHRFGAYGNCYTFNSRIPESLAEEEDFDLPLIQDSSGPTGGLNLLLDIQTWEYSESLALSGNSELGLKFIIHPPYEVPVINSAGYAISPGQKGFIGFTKRTTVNLPKPWGNCQEDQILQYHSDYTSGACAIECRLRRVVTNCGCKPYYYPGDFDICTYDQLEKCGYIHIGKIFVVQNTNLESPWGRCDPERILDYNVNYTVDACAIECKLTKVVQECGCKPYYYPGDFEICSFTQLSECAFVQIVCQQSFGRTTPNNLEVPTNVSDAIVNADFAKLCDCPIACSSEAFDVQLSYASFPNTPYGVQLGRELNISLPPPSPGVPAYDSQSQYLRSNVANLDLYYESMSEVTVNQNKAMDDTALLGIIGGQLGLFIGCSFLTAFEFLECIIMSVLYHCKRGATRKNRKQWSPTSSTDLEMNGNGTSKKINENGSSKSKNGTYSFGETS